MHFVVNWKKPWTILGLNETSARKAEMEHMGAAYGRRTGYTGGQ